MHMPWREMPWAVCFWGVYVLVFSLEARWMLRGRGGAGAQVRDRGSCFAILGIMFIAVAIAFWYADRTHALDFTWRPYAWFTAGLALMLAGALLRQWAMGALGERFTGIVTIRADHELADSGLYRYVRHPSYTGAFMIWAGLGLALTNGVSLIALVAAAVLAYGLRVRAEEAALIEAFGDRYRAYARRTRRFVPWLF